jgi:RNA polymerase sigma factor FliA
MSIPNTRTKSRTRAAAADSSGSAAKQRAERTSEVAPKASISDSNPPPADEEIDVALENELALQELGLAPLGLPPVLAANEATDAAPVSAVVFNPGAMILKYQHVVRQIAGGFQRKLPRNVLRDDLIAAGMGGLWDAVRKHGHEASPNFDWYVRVRIRGAILDELRAQDWLPRRARAAAAEAAQNGDTRASSAPVVLRFDEVSESEQARCLTAGESSNTERTVEANFVKARLAQAMEQLPERERRIVAMHYFRGIKFKDLGEMLGVSEPRISQLHSRAMSRLKVILDDAA